PYNATGYNRLSPSNRYLPLWPILPAILLACFSACWYNLSMLGGVRIFVASEAHASRLDVKLTVPAVAVPALLYFSSITRSHALASLLAGLTVIAVVWEPCFLAARAARMLAFVFPEIDTMYISRPSTIE